MNVPLIHWDAPGPYTVAFSTRQGGVSEGAFESLNLGLLTEDEPQHVEENRRRLCEAVGGAPQRLAMNRQVHAATVNRAEPGIRGDEGDGLWSLPRVRIGIPRPVRDRVAPPSYARRQLAAPGAWARPRALHGDGVLRRPCRGPRHARSWPPPR